MRFNTRPDGRLETVETIHAVEERELQLRTVIARDRGTLRRMLDGNELFHVDPMAAPAMVVGVDLGAPEGDATVVTMHYRAGETVTHTGEPCTLQNLPKPAAEVWHTEAPTVAGVYIASVDGIGLDSDCHRHWDGRTWSESWFPTLGQERTHTRESEEANFCIVWLRLIEADTPASTAQQFVCIRAHQGANDWKVGDIAVVVSANEPDNWRLCDAEGWIAHVPTADAVCPVPEGVEFEVRRRAGHAGKMNRPDTLWQSSSMPSADPVAWRPVVQ